MSGSLPPRYDPSEVEGRLYARWEARGDFTADPERVLSHDRKPFVVMMPPPNVTGALHMGHALNNTLQDVLCRWHRMLGAEVLWLPGIDHAGIATQAVVEKRLFEERKVRRLDLGREKFLEEVWAWKEQYGGTILGQLRRLGCSCDWSRTRFTMDPPLSRAVRKAFVALFEKGLVYRGARVVNWDCVLETAVSDDEIEHEERRGKLWHVRYPRADGEGFVVVATTRPETLLGDTGVAVHPDDPRYRGVAGRKVRLPLLGREIPVVADPSVDPAFGTGAVKVTPGHDPEDYERGKRHGLPIVVVLDGKGRINAEGGPYAGLSREQARDRIVEDLEAQGLLEKVEDHALRVAVSDRSRSIIEPLVSEQWFVRMEPLAGPAIRAVREGTLRFRPVRWTKVYLDWLEGVRDWCISRQLWWGHRIPVWYDEDGATVALLEDPAPGATHPSTGRPLVRQDEDVLDTWASSWLWPLSTLGWPDRGTADSRAFYPTQFLSTAREILYLWVARMVMAGYAFDGRCPFDTVYVHATILDGKGRRMSKSAGNGIDPVDMIGRYGADAVRFTLVDLTTEGQDVRLAEGRFEAGRNFVNKLWNAGRFLEGAGAGAPAERPDDDAFAVEDRWILRRLDDAVSEATSCLGDYRFHEYARALHGFAWNEFCDWYLELIKPRLEGAPDPAAIWTLREVFGTTLRLLQPVCPFLSEELAERLELRPPACDALGKDAWPVRTPGPASAEAAGEIAALQAVVTAVRTLRAEVRVPEAEPVDAVVRAPAAIAGALRRQEAGIRRLGKIGRLEVGADAARPGRSAVAHLADGVEVFVSLEGRIDLAAERERLGREIAKAEALLASVDRKLGNADFVARARPEVVEGERARRAEAEALAGRLRASLAALE
jgi:valyl-tRNA synthetase